ncbi:MAG: hypothetical protein FJX72_05205 [Armatimonadetes bacterium]|nr:hypothetical protein [Armatimonadota bacterium]
MVNAIIHRDYTSFRHVQVRIFRDRLEVWNPGSLSFDVTIENYIQASNQDPKPFIWTKTAAAIIEKIERCKAVAETRN